MSRRLALLALLLLLGARPSEAEDTDRHEPAPGVEYTRHAGDGVVTHVVKVDLKSPSLRVRSVKAVGKETVRDMVGRMDDPEGSVLAAVNGDFFRVDTIAGLPFGVQVSDGRLIFAPMKRSMIGFGPANEPSIEIVRLRGKLSLAPPAQRAGTMWTTIDDVNAMASEITGKDGVYLYTPAFLGLELEGLKGSIAVVEEISPNLQVGDVSEGRLARVETTEEKVEVPASGCLLYFNGRSARSFASSLKPGRPIALKLDLPPIDGGVTQAIGGGPRLVRDGKPSVEIKQEDFAGVYAAEISKRHPRSAVGYDRHRTTLFLVMVEGRHEESRGMTFRELAEYLVDLGCWQAMAFDGGGSAGMYVAGLGFVSQSMSGKNKPEEREVANSLLITTAAAPEGGAPAPESPGAPDAPGGVRPP